MRKIYHLGNCGTCQRIIKDLGGLSDFEFQNIKTEAITSKQLEAMHKLAGSYDALFSRRAMLYKSMGLKDRNLTEKEIRDLILSEYTFLKRPVLIAEERIFIGNTAKVVQAAKEYLGV